MRKLLVLLTVFAVSGCAATRRVLNSPGYAELQCRQAGGTVVKTTDDEGKVTVTCVYDD